MNNKSIVVYWVHNIDLLGSLINYEQVRCYLSIIPMIT